MEDVKALAEPAGNETEPYAALSFEALYADEVDAMARLAFLMVGSTDQAEELVVRPNLRHALGDPATSHDEVDELADVLATLPYRQRAAVVLRYYEDRSEADIAELLGVRPGTVKSLLHRGLARLREVIEP